METVILRIETQKAVMLPNLNPTAFIAVILGVSTFIFIMLLPALVELKHPKDAGPRKIANCGSSAEPRMKEITLITDLEEEQRFDRSLLKKMASVIAALPNAEG